MSAPSTEFGAMACGYVRCDATAAEYALFAVGPLSVVLIVALALVAGLKIGRGNLALPLLAMAVSCVPFYGWSKEVPMWIIATEGAHESAWGKVISKFPEAESIERSPQSRPGEFVRAIEISQKKAWVAWLQLGLIPFVLGLGAKLLRTKKRKSASTDTNFTESGQ